MAVKDHLASEHKKLWYRNFSIALHGTGDARQAESIANERTLYQIMRADAQVANIRADISNNIVRENPAPRYHRDGSEVTISNPDAKLIGEWIG